MRDIQEVKAGELITANKINEIIVKTNYLENNYSELEKKYFIIDNRISTLESKPEPLKSIINTIGMTFMLIPAGEFYMGTGQYTTEKPVRKVTINKPFYLGKYPVTQMEWQQVMNENPSIFNVDDLLPVENVPWENTQKEKGVQQFIRQLNENEGTNSYRLPSEAEWEYACRATTSTEFYFGDDIEISLVYNDVDKIIKDDILGKYAWYHDNSDSKTHPVGKKLPNQWGLYDMYGNVWEWVQDEWHGSYNGAPSDGSAWEDGSGAHRVTRGGSWLYSAGSLRSANRKKFRPSYRRYDLGFRLLKEV